MSRIIKIVGLMAMIAVFGVASIAAASPPVQPPIEGFYIYTLTDINVINGDLTETEDFDWVYGDDPSFDAVSLTMTVGSAAQIKYSESLTARNGLVSLYKPFTADSYDTPNIDVGPKNITYLGASLDATSTFDYTESVGISIVSYGVTGTTAAPGRVLLSICPWATGASSASDLPATNESIVAGSAVSSGVNLVTGYFPDVNIATRTEATTTENPELTYDIKANGFGQFEAYMDVSLQEGHGAFTPGMGTINLRSNIDYSERATATGVVERFNKHMEYKTKFR